MARPCLTKKKIFGQDRIRLNGRDREDGGEYFLSGDGCKDAMPLEGADLCDMYRWGDIGVCPEPDLLFVILQKKKGTAGIKKPGMRIRKVLIICEGYEEEAYLNRLNKCGVWNAGITVEVENAKSGNVNPLQTRRSGQHCLRLQ